MSKVTEELYTTIVTEIARLTITIIHDVTTLNDARGLAAMANHLTAILAGEMDISDFHDQISNCPESVREYYYKLLYLIK